MYKIIEYKDLKDNCILVDMRSPGEFLEYHIPGAISIPLFGDSERALIGTIYKQESVEKAKQLGIEAASKKLPSIYSKFKNLKNDYKIIVIYCARGGLRSGSVCSLFNSLGMNVWQLKGGYKGYRAFVNQELPKSSEQINYIVLHGFTGVGKTEILKILDKRGYDVLDLEGYANHRGSLLGSVGLGECRSQKQFESFIFESLRNRKTNNVFIEAESKKIGNVTLPEYIYKSMKTGKHILVEASIEVRSKLIVEEYIKSQRDKDEIIESLSSLGKYIGNKDLDEIIKLINTDDYIDAAKRLMIKHYDPMYMYSQKNYNYELTVNSDSINEACNDIELWLNNLNNK